MADSRLWGLIVLAVALVACLRPSVAAAALGQAEATVKADATQAQGSVQVQTFATYRVHEIQTPSGTTVREYVGDDGNVFAVAWKGPTMPNLRQTLGKYFDNYVAAARMKFANHRRVQITRDDLVVRAAGHLRAFSGVAYLPKSIPAGVAVGDLH